MAFSPFSARLRALPLAPYLYHIVFFCSENFAQNAINTTPLPVYQEIAGFFSFNRVTAGISTFAVSGYAFE